MAAKLEILRQLIIILVMWVVLTILHCLGKATKYTGCTFLNGQKLTFQEFLKVFAIEQEVVLLDSEQGRVCCVHGIFGGGYMIRHQEATEQDLVAEVKNQMSGDGHLILCSCVNAEHRDFVADGKTFVRDKNSISHWETILLPSVNGSLYIWGSKWVSVYTAVLRKDYVDAWAIAKA